MQTYAKQKEQESVLRLLYDSILQRIEITNDAITDGVVYLVNSLKSDILNFIKNIFSFVFNFFFEKISNFVLLFLGENAFLIYFLFFILTNFLSFFLIFYLGTYGIFYFNLISLVAFWLSVLQLWPLFLVDSKKVYILNLGSWILVNFKSKIDFLIYIDQLSFSFMLLTSSIAIFVYVYAFSYFRYEPHVDRLLIFLNLFVISMILLVIAGNMIVLFLGWELIGLTSFFLINFWTTRIATLKAGFKAFLFNRISDVVLFFTCVYVYYLFNDVTHANIIFMFSDKNFLSINGYNCINIFSFLIIIPACIKSAQIFFHIWLPDSMEAPVPASALIHSATLVSAGVYLVLRFKTILILSQYAVYVLPTIGALTAVLGAVSSAYQTDVKRILAYSTISHCGFLMTSALICDVEFTILYLFVHGFFKAASFICVGNVIRFNYGYQDIRCMGGYAKYLPFEAHVLFICLLYLAGAPFTFGFFMKHFLVASLIQQKFFFYFLYTCIFVASVFGVLYCSKLYYGIFFGVKKSNKHIYTSVNRNDFYNYSVGYGFYSNSTLAAVFAILGLTLTGLVICSVLLIFLYNDFLNLGDFGSISNSKSYFIFKNYTPFGLLFNLGFLNSVVLLVIIIVLSVSFVNIFQVELIFEILSIILVFFFFSSVFFFFFLNVICEET